MTLSRPEQIVLLGLDDRRGNFLTSYLKYALSGAILTDLIDRGRIRIDDKHLVVTSSESTGDDILDEALRTIADSKKPHTIKCWVRGSLADHQRERVLQRLVRAGVLEAIERKVLGIFPYRRYPTHDPGPEEALRAELRTASYAPEQATGEIRAILALAGSCGLTKAFLTKEECREAKGRIAGLVESDPVATAVKAAIQDDEAAAAALASTAAATG